VQREVAKQTQGTQGYVGGKTCCQGGPIVQFDGACLSPVVVLTAAVKNRTESPTTRKRRPPVFGAQYLVYRSGVSKSAIRSLLGLDQSRRPMLGEWR